MRPNDHRSPRERDESPAGGYLRIAGLALALFLSVALLAVAIAEANVMTPELGDIVAFRPGTNVPELLSEPIEAHVLDARGQTARGCVLAPAVIGSEGGSLIVEAKEAAGANFIVHWAGRRTSTGGTDCGPAADLAVRSLDLEDLARIAGGYGAEPVGALLPSSPLAGIPMAQNWYDHDTAGSGDIRGKKAARSRGDRAVKEGPG